MKASVIIVVTGFAVAIVQNVTGMLQAIAHHPAYVQMADRPNR